MSRILWRTNSSGKRSGAFTTPSLPTRMQLFSPAVGEAHLLELLDLLDEAEGARRGDLAAERLEVGEAERVLLAADGRRVVEDVVHLEEIGGLDRDALAGGVVGAEGVALVDDELLDRGRLVYQPALFEERAQLEGRAV